MPSDLPWPELQMLVPIQAKQVYNTSASLESQQDEISKDQLRHSRLMTGRSSSQKQAMNTQMARIRKEIDSQREMLANMVHPAGFEERIKMLKEKEKIEKDEAKVKIAARYEKAQKIKEERELNRNLIKEEEARQLRLRAGATPLVVAPRRLAPIDAGPDDHHAKDETTPPARHDDADTPSAFVTSIHAEKSPPRSNNAVHHRSPPKPSRQQQCTPSPTFGSSDDEDESTPSGGEQLAALRGLRIAKEAEDTLEKAMLRTRAMVVEATRRTVRCIMSEGKDKRGFLYWPATLVQQFANMLHSKRLVQRLAITVLTAQKKLLLAKKAADKRASHHAVPGNSSKNSSPTAAGAAASSAAVGASTAELASSVVRDVIDAVTLTLTREYVFADVAQGRL